MRTLMTLTVPGSSSAGRVRRVPRDTPAFLAGFNVDDEVLAIGDERVSSSGAWGERLKSLPPGTEAEVLISRRGRLIRLPVTFAEEPEDDWALEVDASATPRQERRLESLLEG